MDGRSLTSIPPVFVKKYADKGLLGFIAGMVGERGEIDTLGMGFTSDLVDLITSIPLANWKKGEIDTRSMVFRRKLVDLITSIPLANWKKGEIDTRSMVFRRKLVDLITSIPLVKNW